MVNLDKVDYINFTRDEEDEPLVEIYFSNREIPLILEVEEEGAVDFYSYLADVLNIPSEDPV